MQFILVVENGNCTNPITIHKLQLQTELEGCINDERQLTTAKRSQAPVDATVRKRFFSRDNFVIFRRRSKRIEFGIRELHPKNEKKCCLWI